MAVIFRALKWRPGSPNCASGILPFPLSNSRSTGLLRGSHGHWCLDGVGNEAPFVGEVVEPLFIGWRGQPLATVSDFRVKSDLTHPSRAALVLAGHADRLVVVAVHLEALS